MLLVSRMIPKWGFVWNYYNRIWSTIKERLRVNKLNINEKLGPERAILKQQFPSWGIGRGYQETKAIERNCSFILASVVKMSEQRRFASVAQKIIIKFLAQGVKQAEILRRRSNISRKRHFVELRCLLAEAIHWGSWILQKCWQTSYTSQITFIVFNILRMTGVSIVIAIANDVEINYGSTFSNIKDELEFRKVSVSWTSSLLIHEVRGCIIRPLHQSKDRDSGRADQ